MRREANRANSRIIYLGLVRKNYIITSLQEIFKTVQVWNHIRRCASIKDQFRRIRPYSVRDVLGSCPCFGTIFMSPCFELMTQCTNMSRSSAERVLITLVIYRTTRIGRGRRLFLLLLVYVSIPQRDGISLVLRLGVLERSTGKRNMFGGEVQDMHLCLMVDYGVFGQ
jgi:hypothetical protein